MTWGPQNSGLPAGKYGFQGNLSTPGDGYVYVSIDGQGIYRGTNVTNAASAPINWTPWGNSALFLPKLRTKTPSLVGGVYYVPTGRGVYVSSDNATTWTAFSSGLPGGYVINTVTDSTATSTVYAAADTVYKSTDGGVTWVIAGNGLTGAVGGAQRGSGGNITQASDGTLYVSTVNDGIFKSTDGAANWTPVNNGLPALLGQGMAVRVDSVSAQTIYALYDSDALGVWMSTDGGTNWASITGDLPAGNARRTQEIARDPATGYLYLATNNGVYKSVNGGTNWTAIFTASGAGHVRLDTGTSPATLYWTTSISDSFNTPQASSGVYKSVDQGASYTQLLSNILASNLRVVRTNGLARLYVISTNITNNVNQSRVLKSSDGGVTWQSISAGIRNAFANSLDTANNQLFRVSTLGGGVFNFSSTEPASLAAAIAGVTTAVTNNLISIVNTQGNNLGYNDLAPMFDANFLSDGFGGTQAAGFLASDLRGGTLSNFSITGINSYDEVNGIINILGTITTPDGVQIIDGNNDSQFIFKRQGDGSYRMYGNQQIARTSIQVEMRTDHGPGFDSGPRQHVNIDIEAPQGTLNALGTAHSVTASPNVWPGLLPLTLTVGGTRLQNVQPSPPPAAQQTITKDSFFGGYDPGSTVVSNGTVFRVTLTKADTTQVTYSVPFTGTALNNPATNAITGVTINETTATSFTSALLTSPLNLAWTLPTGYTVTNVSLFGYVQNSNNEQCQVDQTVTADATSGQLTLPTTCGSAPIVNGGINVSTDGPDGSGKRSIYIYNFNIGSSDVTPPTQPGPLTLAGTTANSISFTWTASTDDVAVTGYTVSRNGQVIFTGLSSSPVIDNTLSPSTTYTYSVRACDAAGNCSPMSSATYSTLPPAGGDTTAPTTPGTLTLNSTTANSINFSWSSNSTDNSGVAPTYRVLRNGSLIFTGLATSPVIDTGLAASVSYTYTVAACDASGNCSPPQVAVFATASGVGNSVAPTVPTSPVAVTTGTNQLTISWGLATDDLDFAPRYEIRRNGAYFGSTTSGLSFIDNLVTAGVSYTYDVRACDAANNCSAYATAATVAVPLVPAVPTGLFQIDNSTSQAALRWTAASGATGYNVYRRVSGAGSYSQIASNHAVNAYFVDSGLSGGSAYDYYVTAINGGGESAASNVITATTLACPGADCIAPTLPTNVMGTAAGPTQVNLTWTASSDAGGINHYRIGRVLQSGGTGSYIANTAGAVTSFSDTTAVGSTAYTYFISACDNAGNCSVGSFDIANVTTPAGSGPAAVSLSTATLNFGNQTQFVASANQSVTITNSGGSTLNISSIVSAASIEFVQVGNTCGTTLAAGSNCTFTISFVPQGLGVRTGTLTINDDAAGSPHVVTLNGTGVTATSYQLFLRPSTGTAVRVGETRNFFSVLTKSDGTIINPIPSGVVYSIVSGPATVNASTGDVTGQATAFNALATVQASYTDAVNTGGATLTSTQIITIQASQDVWAAAGNLAQGGDIRTIANTGTGAILTAVYGGGIYRTTSGAANWEQSAFGLPQTGSARVRAIRGALPDGTIVAAVEGSGVYRSLNGGSNWIQGNTGLGSFFPRAFGYRTTNNSLYVATNNGVYKSTNSGASWFSMSSGLPANSTVISIQALSNSETVWAVVSGAGIYRSLDGAATWTAQNSGIPLSGGVPQVYNVTVPPSAGSVILAMVEGAGIYRSSDNGVSWQTQSNNLPAAYGYQGGINTPGDGYLYVAIDGQGIYQGTTGSNVSNPVNWSLWTNSASLPKLRVRAPSLVNGVYYVGTGQGVYTSADNGATWAPFKSGLPRGHVINTVTNPSNTSIVYAAADTVYKSADGGATWSQSDTGITGAVGGGQRGSAGNITMTQNGTLYVSTVNDGVFRSINAGATWTAFNANLPALLGQGMAVRPDPVAADTVYALFDSDSLGVWKSVNGGAWTSITGTLSGNALKTQEIAVDTNGDLYLATNGGLYRSVNGGTTWTATSYTATGVGHVRIDTGTSPSTVYFATSQSDGANNALSSSGVYKTVDQGASYTQLLSGSLIQNLRVVRTGSVVRLYALSWNITSNLNQSRVLKSADGGTTWQSDFAGLPHAFINSLDTANGQVVRASTIGGGVYNFTSADVLPTAAPTGVVATVPGGAGSNNIQVTWNTVSGATGYNVYHAMQSGVTRLNYGSLTGNGLIPNTSSPATISAAAVGTHYIVVTAINAAGESVESTQVSATVVAAAPAVGLSATSLGYGNVSVSQTSAAQSITVTNTGTGTLSISTAAVTGTGFAASANTCTGANLAAGQNCVVSITLTPAGAGAASGSLTVTSNGAGSPHSVTLSGTGVTGSVFTPVLVSGFNLLGNSFNTALNVMSIFGNQTSPVSGVSDNVASVWKWDAANGNWQFHSPLLTTSANATYAANHGYGVLTSIAGGEGYWVNALGPMSLPVQSGSAFNWNGFSFANLPSGFNLIAHASQVTPSVFNVNVSATPPSPGVVPTGNFASLWVWDATNVTWFFYSPLLESSGGLAAVKNYADAHFFEHFQDFSKKIDVGIGFWVNKF